MNLWSVKKLRRRLNYTVLMSKIFNFLEKDSWQIYIVRIKEYSEGKELHGFTDGIKKRIYIDVRSELIPTLIHECLHPLMADWNGSGKKQEEFIIIIEKFLSRRLTNEHICRLRNILCTKDKFLAKSFPKFNNTQYFKERVKYCDTVLDKLLKR